jgi:hypothetical protein
MCQDMEDTKNMIAEEFRKLHEIVMKRKEEVEKLCQKQRYI